MYIQLFVVLVVYLTPIHSTPNPLCIRRDIGYICYTIHEDIHPQKLAHEECRKTSGRLVTIMDNTIQTFLDSHINGSQNISVRSYWLGATLEASGKWTPIDDQHPTYTLPLFQSVMCHIRGNLIIGLFQESRSNSFIRWLLLKTFIRTVIDLIRSNVSEFCQSLKTSPSECQKAYHWIPGFRTFLGVLSAICRIVSRVHPADDGRFFDFIVSENKTDFIGVRSVQMMWDLGESQMEANFINWADEQPKVSGDSTEPLCVFASPGDWKWQIASCNQSKAFVCENAKSATSNTSEAKGTVMSIVRLTVALIVIVAICIVVGLLCNFRTKLLLLQQTFASMQAFSGSGSGSRRPWSNRVPEDESFYVLINDANEVEDGYSAIDTAAETGRKVLPPYAVVKKIPKSQSAGADGGINQSINHCMETAPAVHPKQPPENLDVDAAAGNVVGYGSLQPCTAFHHANTDQRAQLHHHQESDTRLGFDNLVYHID